MLVKIYQLKKHGKGWTVLGPLEKDTIDNIDFPAEIASMSLSRAGKTLAQLKTEIEREGLYVYTFLYHLEAPGKVYQVFTDRKLSLRNEGVYHGDLSGQWYTGWVSEVDPDLVEFTVSM